MKLAVISDIHANYTALEAVLDDIKTEGCEKIFCLGDLALAGPEPQKVVDFFQSTPQIEVIQGNTDKMIAEFSPELLKTLQEAAPVMASAIQDDVKVLTEEQKEYLKNLPPKKELEIEGVKILLVHGSPRRNNEDIMPNLPIEKVEEIIKDTETDLIFCGHTHIPCGYQTNNKQTVVNVGSVGRPMTKDLMPCYAVVELKNSQFSVKHKFVDYDRNFAAEIVRKRGFELCDKLAEMLVMPTERHI